MTSVRDQASARVEAVDAAFERALGEWTGVGVTLGSIVGITPKDQVLSAIRQMKTLGRDPWAARRDKLADSDAAGWSRWIADGNDLLKNLDGIAQDAKAGSLPGIVVETVAATKQDVQTAAKAVWDAKYVLAAIAVALAVVVWRVKP